MCIQRVNKCSELAKTFRTFVIIKCLQWIFLYMSYYLNTTILVCIPKKTTTTTKIRKEKIKHLNYLGQREGIIQIFLCKDFYSAIFQEESSVSMVILLSEASAKLPWWNVDFFFSCYVLKISSSLGYTPSSNTTHTFLDIFIAAPLLFVDNFNLNSKDHSENITAGLYI